MVKILGKVAGQLEGIQAELEAQQETTFRILEIVAEIRYRDGIEKIEAVYTTFIKGLFIFRIHN
jgi:hypothetical protein